eukprot:1180365-Prorocentrum_minimum.AAC.1
MAEEAIQEGRVVLEIVGDLVTLEEADATCADTEDAVRVLPSGTWLTSERSCLRTFVLADRNPNRNHKQINFTSEAVARTFVSIRMAHQWCLQWRQRLHSPEEVAGGLVTDCSVEGNVARFLSQVNEAGCANLAVVKVSTGESRDNRKVRLFAFARETIHAGQVLTVANDAITPRIDYQSVGIECRTERRIQTCAERSRILRLPSTLTERSSRPPLLWRLPRPTELLPPYFNAVYALGSPTANLNFLCYDINQFYKRGKYKYFQMASLMRHVRLRHDSLLSRRPSR